jgi:hypothetical protein
MKGIFVPGSLVLEQSASAGIFTSAFLSMFKFENKLLWNAGKGNWVSLSRLAVKSAADMPEKVA